MITTKVDHIKQFGTLLLSLVLAYFAAKLIVSSNTKMLVFGVAGLILTIACLKIDFAKLLGFLFISLALGSFYRTDIAQSTYYFRFFLLLLCAVRGFFEFNRTNFNRELSEGSKLSLWLFGFALLGLISSIYSLDQKITLLRAGMFFLLIFFLFVGCWFYLKTLDECERFVRILVQIFFILTAVGWVFVFLGNPLMFKMGRLRLLLGNPNQLAHVSAILLPVIAWCLFSSRNKGFWYLYIFLVVLAVFWSGSRAGILGGVLGLSVFVYRFNPRYFYGLVGVGLFLVLLQFLVVDYFNIFASSEDLIHNRILRLESLETGSGRTGVWKSAWELILKKPWFGYGFGITDRMFEMNLFKGLPLEFQGGHTHNGYIEEWLNMGLLGTLPLILVIAFSLSRFLFISTSRFMNYSQFQLALYGMVLVGSFSSFFESWLTSVGSIFCFPFWLSVMMLAKVEKLKEGE